MNLPNVNIVIGNGNMGHISLSDDGIAGLILTGVAVVNKLARIRIKRYDNSNEISI